jgi:hypothetical protein
MEKLAISRPASAAVFFAAMKKAVSTTTVMTRPIESVSTATSRKCARRACSNQGPRQRPKYSHNYLISLVSARDAAISYGRPLNRQATWQQPCATIRMTENSPVDSTLNLRAACAPSAARNADHKVSLGRFRSVAREQSQFRSRSR